MLGGLGVNKVAATRPAEQRPQDHNAVLRLAGRLCHIGEIVPPYRLSPAGFVSVASIVLASLAPKNRRLSSTQEKSSAGPELLQVTNKAFTLTFIAYTFRITLQMTTPCRKILQSNWPKRGSHAARVELLLLVCSCTARLR